MFHVKHYINKCFTHVFYKILYLQKTEIQQFAIKRENVSRETFHTNFPIEKNM